ncbi:MAG: YicC family protein [Bacillota bacterium]|nr:YicC family protein [Bacillota bacterium]
MLRSMTGYGRGEAAGHQYRVEVELKAVNHRYADFIFRLPKGWAALEDRLRRLLQAQIFRGRVEVEVRASAAEGVVYPVAVDLPLLKGYLAAIAQVQAVLGQDEPPDWRLAVQLPGVLQVSEEVPEHELIWPVLAEAAQRAVAELLAMRLREGAHLAEDISARLQSIQRWVKEIEGRKERVVEEYRQKLSARVQEMLGHQALDEWRLAAEVALFAERSDIAEEVVRLQSHAAQLEAILSGDEPAVGRKLDFLLQEMHREVNTMAAKTTDLEIVQRVILIKGELDKIREQVQNVE